MSRELTAKQQRFVDCYAGNGVEAAECLADRVGKARYDGLEPLELAHWMDFKGQEA